MASERPVWLWVREDGPPKILERGKRPPGPGRVFEVLASTREAAEKFFEDARKMPALDDTAQWLATEQAKRRVREVDVGQWIKAKDAASLVGEIRFDPESGGRAAVPAVTASDAQEK